ncbi:hypothetical protein ACPPVT_21530 [Angustibacter sp. McL0619]|uniref:hypothetical protein n=1 Tax=Angustibacter sp. McL0619 TaxID=3415676 RepID=UPI003CE8BDC1
MTLATLEQQAQQFAADLTDTVKQLVPDCSPFHARTLTDSAAVKMAVRQEPDTGIPLMVSGEPLLTLKVSYSCCLDGHQRYLAVDESKVAVYAGAKAQREPLFRYEYVRRTAPDLPSAHLQLHAHRDAFTRVMGRAGESTPRGRRRARADAVPQLNELHFPLGGHRFRPCLEDVMEMLVTEFGVDSTAGQLRQLAVGRERWRRKQLRSVVRDAPREAVEVLRSLGYSVDWNLDDAEPEENVTRLRDF